jgi:hypothetical protein
VNFGVTVESVEPPRETPPETCRTSTPVAGSASRTLRPSVRLRTGETLHADIILGADGRRSMVRRAVTDEQLDATSYGISRYTGSVPMAEVHNHAALTQLVDVGSSWPIWFGERRGALGTPKLVLSWQRTFLLLTGSSGSLAFPVVSPGYRSGNGRELMIPGPSFTATAPGIHCRSMVGR